MLEFLVAQNWEGAEALGPGALRSSLHCEGEVWSSISIMSALTEWAGVRAREGSLSDVAVSEAYD